MAGENSPMRAEADRVKRTIALPNTVRELCGGTLWRLMQ